MKQSYHQERKEIGIGFIVMKISQRVFGTQTNQTTHLGTVMTVCL